MLRAALVTLALSTIALAGCVSPPEEVPAAGVADLPVDVGGILPVTVEDLMAFTQSIVSPAVGLAGDLYEPTMEVSDTGTLYVAGHVIAAATTGTPAYYSTDDGATWAPLPFLASLQTPSPLQGSQPPPGDEGFIVAGDDGQAWMADIYAAGFSITGWCDDGATQCYDNRQAYDRVESTRATTECRSVSPTLEDGPPVSLNDRPWAAFGGGSLLLVNNPGGGPMQIGIMDVPPAAPVGLATVMGPVWNTCASPGGGIPGIPSMRDDGLFAVPQMFGGGADAVLNVVVGNKADIFAVETRAAFPVTSSGAGTSNGGRTAFDAAGALFVGARNNTEDGEGRFILATSTDDGATFKHVAFSVGSSVRSLYLDGNMFGPGALLTWSQVGESEGRSDWYVAHVFVGPDGRAYFLNFEASEDPAEYAGSTPISVWIQQDGPTLPYSAATAAE